MLLFARIAQKFGEDTNEMLRLNVIFANLLLAVFSVRHWILCLFSGWIVFLSSGTCWSSFCLFVPQLWYHGCQQTPHRKLALFWVPFLLSFWVAFCSEVPLCTVNDAVSLKSERCSEILCNVSVCCVCVCRPPVPYGHTQRECLVSFSPSLTFNLPILDLCPWVFPSAMIFFHLSSSSLLTPFHPFPPITVRTLTLDPPFTFDLHLFSTLDPWCSLYPWHSLQLWSFFTFDPLHSWPPFTLFLPSLTVPSPLILPSPLTFTFYHPSPLIFPFSLDSPFREEELVTAVRTLHSPLHHAWTTLHLLSSYGVKKCVFQNWWFVFR